MQFLLCHFILKYIKENESACSNYSQRNINVDDILSNIKYIQEVVKHENKIVFYEKYASS